MNKRIWYKRLLLTLGVVLILATNAGCKKKDSGGDTGPKVYEIAVMVKSLNSDFWQIVLDGANRAAAEFRSEINVTNYGARVEIDIDEQISVLENIINSKPAAIVRAATTKDALVPQIEQAMDGGIPVIIIDSDVSTSKFVSFLRTDNVKGGAIVADEIVKQWQAAGINPSGKRVQVIQALAGVQTIIDREDGFRARLLQLVPDIVFLETQYTNNDVDTTMSTFDNVITANGDNLIGVFATNNTCSIGVARAIAVRGIKDKCIGMGFDAEQEEIDAVNEGILKGFVVQDPWGMGYLGVTTALKHLKGERVDREVDTGATLVTKVNINDPAMAALIDTSKRTAY